MLYIQQWYWIKRQSHSEMDPVKNLGRENNVDEFSTKLQSPRPPEKTKDKRKNAQTLLASQLIF